MDADVAVIGVGAIGSMAMWRLAERGQKVLGFEQFGIGHDRSAVGGGSRIFRTAYKEGFEYVPLNQKSLDLWRELEEKSSNDLLTLNGCLTIGNAQLDSIKNVKKSIDDFNLEHEILDRDQAKKYYPQHTLLEDEIMILDKNGGFLRPERSIISAVKVAVSYGAEAYSYTKVLDVIPDDKGVTIITNEKSYRVKKAVITAGPWTDTLIKSYKKQLINKRFIMTWFSPLQDISLFEPDKFPSFSRNTKGHTISGAPIIDGNMVRISNNTKLYEMKDSEEFDKNVRIDELNSVINSVKSYFPDLNPFPVRSDAFMDNFSPDKNPIVGSVPGMENTISLCGFSGHGFKYSPIMGNIAADFVEKEGSDDLIDALSSMRLSD